jgi:gamma-glutamylcyclotransferase (GGCT)/AIG2-like uncharacterized protein YtfP
MKMNKLKELREEVRRNGYHEQSNKLFAGAGILVCKESKEVDENLILVRSQYAAEISAIIFHLRDLCEKQLNYLNKYEFYGRLAESANKYIGNYGDEKGVIEAIIEEAEKTMKELSSVYYFAYGSNMNKDQMSKRCPDAKFICTLKLPDYKFTLDCAGVATIIETKKHYVQGILWLITEDDMDNLDRYEGISSGCYKKEYIHIPEMHKEVVHSEFMLVYVSLRSIVLENKRPDYMDEILKAAKDWDFDQEYIVELEKYLK